MVAINKILLPECTGEGCGGDTGTCTDSRVHLRNAQDRVPATRNHRRTQPLVNNLYQGMTLDAVTGLYDDRARDYSPSLGRWMEQDPAQFINGANTYQFVNSSPVGNVDAQGRAAVPTTVGAMQRAFIRGRGNWSGTTLSTPAKAGFGDTAHLEAQFNVNRKVFANTKCVPCEEIKFVQFYTESYIFLLWTRQGGAWQLDLDHSKSPPFYAFQVPWVAGERPTEATMQDNPGIWQENESFFFEEDFMTWAVCVKGKEAGRSYGVLHWGILVHQWKTTTIWMVGAAPWRSTVTSGTAANLRIP